MMKHKLWFIKIKNCFLKLFQRKNYFIFENHKYHIRETLGYDDVVLLQYDILKDLLSGNGSNKLYLREYIIKYNLLKHLTTYPLSTSLIDNYDLINCYTLWDAFNKTCILRTPYYKTLLADINKNIDFYIHKMINDPEIESKDIFVKNSEYMLDVIKKIAEKRNTIN